MNKITRINYLSYLINIRSGGAVTGSLRNNIAISVIKSLISNILSIRRVLIS